MSQSVNSKSKAAPTYYDTNYVNFQTPLYADIRREAFGEDIGQNSWLTAKEQDLFLGWLDLSPGKRLLDETTRNLIGNGLFEDATAWVL